MDHPNSSQIENSKQNIELSLLSWMKSIVTSSIRLRDYIQKVSITESKPVLQWHPQLPDTNQSIQKQQKLIRKFDKIQFKYINLLTTLLNINSLLVVGGAYAKLKLSWKFIGIFMTVGYINLSWNFQILKEIVKNRINQKETLIRYWHKQYFRDHVGQFLQSKNINRYRNYLTFQDIYINTLREI